MTRLASSSLDWAMRTKVSPVVVGDLGARIYWMRQGAWSDSMRLFFSLKPSAQHVDEGFDSQLDERKGFADEIVRAGHGGIGARLEIVQSGDKDHRGLAVVGQGAEFGAQFKTIHT